MIEEKVEAAKNSAVNGGDAVSGGGGNDLRSQGEAQAETELYASG